MAAVLVGIWSMVGFMSYAVLMGRSAAACVQEVCLALSYVNDRGVRAGAVNVGDFGSSFVNGQFACASGAKPALLLNDAPHTVPSL
jgi:hypothetical protein